jgi:cephalosporin hydroxylase
MNWGLGKVRNWVGERWVHPYVLNSFHRRFYSCGTTWKQNTFLGYPIAQNPLDLQLYQELVVSLRPAFIVQTGVAGGGSVLYFAALLDLIQADVSCVVVGVDLQLSERARSLTHPRVRLVEGSSTDEKTLGSVRALLPAPTGMVSLDSDHSCRHVLAELRAYREMVGVGSYLVVEDTNINGHPVLPNFGPGPFEAVEEFLQEDKRFCRDEARWQRNLFSHHQHGWLKRERE